jgi:sporulation protein YlmC with PRC-barrel domain
MFGMPGRRLVFCSVLAAWPLQAMSQTAPGQPVPVPETTATIAAPAVLNYLARQSASQRLATSFIGKNVYDPDGQKIGDVSDIVLDAANGSATAIVIGVGGFLGIGQKDVAVPMGAFRIENREGRQHLLLGASREDLRSAPPFVRADPKG